MTIGVSCCLYSPPVYNGVSRFSDSAIPREYICRVLIPFPLGLYSTRRLAYKKKSIIHELYLLFKKCSKIPCFLSSLKVVLQEWVFIQSVVLRLQLRVVCLSMLSAAWIKHRDQNLLGKKRVYFKFTTLWSTPLLMEVRAATQCRNLAAGMGECC